MPEAPEAERGAAGAVRALERITRYVARLGIACLVAAIGLVVLDILIRRVAGGLLIGTVDLTQLSVMAAAFWSMPYGFAADAHVKVELFAEAIPHRLRVCLDCGAALLSAAFVGFVTWLSWGRAMEQFAYGDASQDLAIPMIVYWGFLLSGGVLATLAALAAAWRAAHAAGAR